MDAPKIIWLQRPNRDPENEWCGEVTWCEDKQNDDDTCYIKAGTKTANLANEYIALRQRVAELEKERDELVKALEFIARMRWDRDSEKVVLDALAKLGADKTGEKCEPVAVVHEELECDPYGTTGTGRLTIVPIKAMDKSGLRENDLLYLHPTPDVEQDAKRYRWLRREQKTIRPMASVVWKRYSDRNGIEWVNVVDIDAAIDAAMKETP